MKTAVICIGLLLIAGARMTPIQREVTERILEDEEIWNSDNGRLSDSDKLFFMRRAEDAARNIANGAEKLSGKEREDYISNMLNGEYAVKPRLKAEILERARDGNLPAEPLVPSVKGSLFRIPDIAPYWYIVIVVGLLIAVQAGVVIFGSIKDKFKKRR